MRNLKRQVIFLIIISLFFLFLLQSIVYLNYQSLIKRKANEYFSEVVSKLKDNIESELGNIKKTSDLITGNQTVKAFLSTSNNEINQEAVYNLIDSFVKENESAIMDIKILDKSNKAVVQSQTQNNLAFSSFMQDYSYEQLGYNFTFYSRIYSNDTEPSFVIFSPIISSKEFYQERIGSVVIICKVEPFRALIENSNLQNTLLFLSDNGDTIVAANRTQLINANRYEVLNDTGLVNQNQFGEITFEGQSSLIKSVLFIDPEWRLFVLIPIDVITSDLTSVRTLEYVLGIVASIIILVFGIIILKNINQPISRMVSQIKMIGQDNDFPHLLDIDSKNEIGIIANNINSMLIRLANMNRSVLTAQQDLFASEIAKKQARLTALQSQINPHFLYNTLECIRSIASVNHLDSIMQISNAMANIFRYAIKEQDIVLVQDEILCIKNYFTIISIRFNERFKLSIDLPDYILDKRIIKMTLQPIVENAVYHGLEQKEGEGHIYIRGEIDSNSMIVIEIIDDGIGINQDTLNKLNEALNSDSIDLSSYSSGEHRSIGLVNICNRLRMTYSNNYLFEIQSGPNSGTKIKIAFPDEKIRGVRCG